MNWFSIQLGQVQACLMALLLLAGQQLSASPPAINEGHASPPSWSVNPDDYEFNMSAVIRLNFNGVPSNATGNLVAAFVGNELRGVATPVIIGGNAYFFLTIYANQYTGETVHFKTYYAPNDAVYPNQESATFTHNLTIGSSSAPFFINIDPNADYPPELEPILADTTLVGIPFDPIDLADYTVSQDGDPVTWSAQPGPNLMVGLVNGILTVSPVSGSWIGTDSVRIIVKETTPNQLSDTITAWFTVLPDYGLPVWGTIPNQTIFPGDSFTAFDLDNYLTFAGPCRQFDFDVFPFTGSALDPGWPVVVPGNQPMTVIVRPLFADVQLAGANAKLAGFVNGILAGWAAPVGVFPNISYSLSLKNVGAGNITFKLYDAAHQYLYEELSSLTFVAGGSVGTVSSPYLLQLSPLVPALAANGVVTIAIDDPTWLGAYPIDFIVWDCNFPARRDTTQAIFTITTDLRPNITSPATVNYEENACAVLYDTQAADPTNSEGAGLTYSLAGGTDVSRFAINASNGILSWAVGFSPNFETPMDADMNNKYQVNIQVTNAANLADTLALTVTITNQAVEPFAALINNGAGPLCGTGNVDLLATGGIAYVWSTGATTAAIVVSTAGTYMVTATSTGACTATASIVVAAPPTITAAGSNTPICIGALVQLSSTPSGGTPPYASFAWTGPNGYTSNVEDPAGFPATATSGGTYTVTVTDAAGCTATASKVITTSGSSAPTITAMSNTPVCVGASIVLTSTPAGGTGAGYTYLWAGPNNFLGVVKNPPPFAATPAAGGTYSVTLTDGAGCTGVGMTTVTVNARPTVTASSNSPVSLGSNLQLSALASGGSGSGYTYSWSGPNNFTSTLAQPTPFVATMAAIGTYQVTVTDGGGCTNTSTTTVAVVTCPTIAATLGGPVCTGGTIILQSAPQGGALPYASFSWTGPNSYSASVQNPASFPASAAANGTYTVKVTDQLGCTATATVAVMLHTLPTVTATNSGPVCEGGSISLNSTPAGGSGTFSAFLWTGPDAYVATVEDPAAFSTTLASAGLYQIKVTDSNGCTATNTTNVIVNSIPTITASSNQPVCLGSTLNLQSTTVSGNAPYTYNWTGPSGYTSTQEDPNRSPVVLTFAGIYRVTVTDNAGCSSTSTTPVTVTNIVGPTITAASNSPVCGGTSIVLTSTPSGGTTPYTSFAWSGPNSYTATQEDPPGFIGYVNASGTYTVTVTDNNNCKASASVALVVNGPAVNVTSNSPVCPGSNILLSAGAVLPAGTTYAWTGPNGFSSTVRNPPGFIGVTGTYSVTVTAAGCSNTGSVLVMVADITPPVIVCPANTTIAANANCSSLLGTLAPASVSDNCTANPTVTQSPAASTVLSGHNNMKTVTLTASDASGNTASCSFTMTLKDVTPPVITCPANTTIAASEICDGVLGAYSPLTLSDNCAVNLTVGQSPVATTVLNGHNDVEVVTISANDGNGNVGTCTFTVTLKDVTPPSITCPPNVSIAANASCTGLVGAYSAVTVGDNCSANPTVTQSPAPTTVLSGHNDVEVVTLTANDGNGNTASCTLTVTLKDVTAPAITCPANTTIAANASCAGAVGAYAPATLSDNCNPNPTVTQSPSAATGLSGHNDSKIITLLADDGNGNTASCTFTVTLKDITPPVITCPANATVAADASCSGAVGAYTPVAVSDNCAANPTVTQGPPPATVLSGHNDVEAVTLTANDGNGNIATCTFTVTLKDVTPPTITCPANATIAANATCSGVIGAYSAVSVGDNCAANPTVTQSPAPATVLSGHNDVKTVTLTADDGNGNTAICTLTVTLKDVTPPTITCPANTTVAAGATCTSPIGAYNAVSVGDNCNPNPTVTQSPVASTLLSGHNDVKTVTLTANDGNGNTTSCTFTVTLKDITPPTVVCKTFQAALNAAGTTSITTANVFQSGADNCGTVNQVSVVPNTFTCSNLGPNTVVLTVNDGNGNTSTCTAVVTVVDLIPPTMLCKPLTVYLNAAGTASATAAQINNGSTDNCTLVTLSLSPATYTCANVGPTTVTLTATDQSGNTATCQNIVTVLDTIRPTMLCKNATINLAANGQATLIVADINNGSFDNCSIATLVLSQTSFTCAQLGANPVTLTGTDPSGNTASCMATVIVQDLIAPVAKCKNATLNLGANGQVTVLPAAIDNGSTDNCSFTLSVTPPVLTCANLGIHVVTLKATDLSGNMNTCTASVTIKDVTPPTALCKNLTVTLDNLGKASLTAAQVNNGSTDNCSIASVTLSITQFSCADIGATVNDFLKVTDGSGNMSTCMALITVKDVTPPVAICQNVSVVLGPGGSVTVQCSALASGSYDNCSVWSFTPVAKTYTAANIGPNNLLITVKDFSGNAASCTSVVTVSNNLQDTVPVEALNMLVYPNPAVGDVSVQFTLPYEQDVTVGIFDLTGKLSYRQKTLGQAGENTLLLGRNLFSTGLYLIHLQTDGKRGAQRVMIRE